jgi:hypothetical protein
MIAEPEKGLVIHPGGEATFNLPADAREADFWDAWVFAAVESALALEAWLSAAQDEKLRGYWAYIACLNREEAAAMALADRVDPAAAARLRAAG